MLAAMFIPGPRLRNVFASRWKALLWAGGIVLTVYLSIGDVAGVKQAVDAGALASSTAPDAPANPWAKRN
jgi:hypothetical protein